MELDNQSPAGAYDPSTHRMLSFHDALPKFLAGTDTPRDYLERCIERIEQLEPAVMAFVFLNLNRARSVEIEEDERHHGGLELFDPFDAPLQIIARRVRAGEELRQRIVKTQHSMCRWIVGACGRLVIQFHRSYAQRL